MFSDAEIAAAMALAGTKPASEDDRKLAEENIVQFREQKARAEHDVRLGRAKTRSVMIATPVARDPAIQYTVSLLATAALLNNLGIPFGCEFLVGSSNLPRARNGLVARFLASDFTDLLMIDDDMGWDAGSVVRMLASEAPLLAAAGRKRSMKPNTDPNVWCVQFLKGATGIELDDMGAIKVSRVGGAFVKFDRSVFDRLIAAHPGWKREGHDDMTDAQRACYHQFFRFDTERDLEEVGEDYLLCDRWREIGGEVWVDPSIELKHCGSFEFTGRLIEILRPAPIKSDVPLAAE